MPPEQLQPRDQGDQAQTEEDDVDALRARVSLLERLISASPSQAVLALANGQRVVMRCRHELVNTRGPVDRETVNRFLADVLKALEGPVS